MAKRHRGGNWQDRTEEELTRDLEAYMQRHPCILDQALGVLKRNPWVYQVCVLSLTFTAAAINYSYALSLPVSGPWVLFWSVVLLLDCLVYAVLCLHPPRTAQKDAEAGGGQNYCSPCAQWQPPRTSHCRVCGQCVLVRDHHCPWTGRCVGEGNMHNFLLYLFYTTVLSCFGVALTLLHFIAVPLSSLSLFALSFAICLFGAGVCSALFARTSVLVLKNFTKVEIKRQQEQQQQQPSSSPSTSSSSTSSSSNSSSSSSSLAYSKKASLLDALPESAIADTTTTITTTPTNDANTSSPTVATAATTITREGALAPSLPSSPPQLPPSPSLFDILSSQPSPHNKGVRMNVKERLGYPSKLETIGDWVKFAGWFLIPELA